MSNFQILLVAGTHGNEINAPWLFDQWSQAPNLIDTYGLKIVKTIGNPLALNKGQRYLDRDLNRSFSNDLLNDSNINDQEICRARHLINEYGPRGKNPSQIVIDFHSTTASMGSSLVVYGRRPTDLALASLVQHRLGLPIYLHEGDPCQKGFLVESWPCGFVVEIGPVPQGILHQRIVDQTVLVLECCLRQISNSINSLANFPSHLVVHRHLKNIDFPRDHLGRPAALIHPDLQDKDWYPIKYGQPLFINLNGEVVKLSELFSSNEVVPVFINEAAYAEKNIAMGLTNKEVWEFDTKWIEAFLGILST